MDKYNQHCANNNNKLIEITPEFLYLTIPAKYVCVYHKLLVYLADFGKKLLDDCSASCKGNNKTIVDCWNLFQSALACYSLQQYKQADLFINYINKQLDNIYRGEDKTVYNGVYYFPISDDGTLKALCSCNDNVVKFYVDETTGNLYEQYLEEGVDNFYIKDNDLIVTSKNNV